MATTYLFDDLRTRDVLADMRYLPTDPAPGDLIPAFDLPTLDGDRFRSDTLGHRPVLLVFGSQTCPVTRSAVPPLRDLHDEYGDRVRFVLVQTREAHPGELLPQPRTDEQKAAHAATMRDDLRVPFEVAVDDLAGTLHRAVGPKPNSAYVLRPDGTITARVHWANDAAALRSELEHVLHGTAALRHRGGATSPLLKAVGHLPEVVRRAGNKAERDVWRAVPPLALLGRTAGLLRGLPVDRRGPAAAAVLTFLALAVTAGIVVAS
ncbi:TlpA family protein disulfide reductase [Cellulomonas palmilytica]|uniref:TlpA family protein disulfide reductase n=1 Tax=Cellulomonas palmilytica TaxID=2608402 RepID=UPI001F216384|nr:redoxin domain-containing protein [Cellulomonas palmilytica]UJP40293.1 redoxin domain-containing protein [Cellulomonas palmilytica]